jgi:hypothetical protein
MIPAIHIEHVVKRNGSLRALAAVSWLALWMIKTGYKLRH